MRICNNQWTLQLHSESEAKGMTERTFVMVELHTSKELSITHLHYTEWPE